MTDGRGYKPTVSSRSVSAARVFKGLLLMILPIAIGAAAIGWWQNASSTAETEQFMWDAHAGTTLNVLANEHPWLEVLKPRLEAFENKTGINVVVDVFPEDQFRAKRDVELMSGVTEIDLFMIMPGNSLSRYHSRGWVEPFNAYFDRPELTIPEYDREDFYEAAIDAGVRDGQQYTVPILLETSLLAYNRELFDRYRISVPQTMDELEAAARTVYEESGGAVYGITLRARGAAATSQWADFLYSFGGTWIDSEGNAALDSPAAVEALEYYGRLLREYGPRDANRNQWYESVSLFTQGRAAMIYDANVFRPHYEDPSRSVVYDKVGYAVIPEGPAGRIPHISHWGLALNPGSADKDAAWVFIQWATSVEIARAAHNEGIPAARPSIWHLEENESDWQDASTLSYSIGDRKWNPPVMNVGGAREVVGRAIVASVLGEDVTQAARAASAELDHIIEEERQ